MNTRLTALAAAMAVLSAPTFAAGALEVYGKANLTLQNTDDEAQNASEGADRWELKSNASRLGVKGELSISDDTVAFYTYELELDVTDNDKIKEDNTNKVTGEHIKSRNQFIGLKGNFGTVLAGRSDTPFKNLQQKVDLFHDYDADPKALFTGEARANNVIQYSTPKLGFVTLNVATFLQEKYDTDAVTTDDSQDGLFDATSLSAEFAITDSFYIGVGMDNDHTTASYQDGAKDTRVVARYTLGSWQFGAMWQKHDEADGHNTNGNVDAQQAAVIDSPDGMLFSVSYKLGENGTLKLQHSSSDIILDGGEQNAIGYDHKLAKNVMFFAWYSMQDQDADNKAKDILAAGLEVKF